MATLTDAAERQMDDRPQLWRPVAGGAMGLGLLADLLFNGAAIGINVPLWLGSFIAVVVLACRRFGKQPERIRAGLLAASFALSLMVAWRSAASLQAILLAAALTFLLLAAVAEHGLQPRRVSITHLFASLVLGLLSSLGGALRLSRAAAWRSWLTRSGHGQIGAIVRAMLIAAPVVLVFGGLFVAADAVFESWVTNRLIDVPAAARHVGWVAGGTWAAAGLLWCGVATERSLPAGLEPGDDRRLRSVELGIVLGSLVALFAAFVGIQVQYLFGGDAHVQASTGLTYAEYARRGFFELVTVAVLLLPVLLTADWARSRSSRSLGTFRIVAVLLVLLLFVVMASAFERLRIYVDAFGLTTARLYAAALLTWLATVFVWLLWSLLRERREEFVVGAILTAVAALVVLVSINPHGAVARTNLSRVRGGSEFDVGYAVRLSADAVPTLVAGVDDLPDRDACRLARWMLETWDSPEHDFRSWNWARQAAREAVGAGRERLQSACGQGGSTTHSTNIEPPA